MAVQVEGARRLRATLKAAGDDLSDLKAANRRAASTVAPVGKALAPKKTGKLVGSVRVTATARVGVVRAGYKKIPYAGPIHYGWPARGIKAQPFLTTAAKETEPVWVPIYEADMYAAIAKVKGK